MKFEDVLWWIGAIPVLIIGMLYDMYLSTRGEDKASRITVDMIEY